MTAVYYESGGSAQEYHTILLFLLLLSFQAVELFCAGGLAEVHQSSREKLPTISRA